MKKLLALLASTSLVISAGSVTGCTYINFYKQSIKNKINELVNVSKLAIFPAIAGAAGTDGEAARVELNDKNVNDYSSLKQTNKITDALKGYFGSNYNFFDSLSSVEGLSDDEKQEMYGTKYQENTWSTIYGAFNTIYGLIGQGLSAQLVNTLLSLLSSFNLGGDTPASIDSILLSVQSTFTSFDIDKIDEHFNDYNDSIITNQDYINWFFSDISSFLNDCTEGDTENGVIKLTDLQGKDDYWKTIINKFGYFFDLYINQGKVFTFDINSFITYVPTALFALSQYISAFDKYENSDISNKSELSDDECNHLFSETMTNYKVVQNVSSSDAVKQNKFSSDGFDGLLNALNILFSTETPNIYSFNRILQILFNENDDPNNVRLFSIPTSGDGTDSPKYDSNGTGGSLWNHNLFGITKGEWGSNASEHNYGLNPLISSLLYGLLNNSISGLSGTLGFDNSEQMFSSIGNVLSLVLSNNNLTNTIKNLSTDLYGVVSSIPFVGNLLKPYISQIIPYISVIQKYANKPLSELMFGDELLPQIISLLETLNIQIPDSFKSIKNINELLEMGINVMGADINIKQIIGVATQILPMALANMKSFVNLINKMVELPTSKFTFYNGDNVQEGETQVTESNNYLEFDGVKCQTGLSFALMLIDQSKLGWQCSVDGAKQSNSTMGKSLLGYKSDSTGGSIIDNSIFSQMRDLLNDKSKSSIQQTLSNIKSFLESATKSFSNEKSSILDSYMNQTNYTISDISYKNFSNNNEVSTLNYYIAYSFNNIKLKYFVEIKLDPNESGYYKFSKIKKIN